MGNLLDSLANRITNRVEQIAVDTVSTAVRRVERTAADAVDSAAREVGNRITSTISGDSIYAGVSINGAGPALMNAAVGPLVGSVPGVLQPALRSITDTSVRAALDVRGEIFGKGIGASIDVSLKPFQSGVGIDSYINLSSGLNAIAADVGMAANRVNRIVNSATSLISNGIDRAGEVVKDLLGTTKLDQAGYDQYKDVAVSCVRNEYETAGLTQLGRDDITVGVVTSGSVTTTDLAPLDGGATSQPVETTTIVTTELPPLDSTPQPLIPENPTAFLGDNTDSAAPPDAYTRIPGYDTQQPDAYTRIPGYSSTTSDFEAQTEGEGGMILEDHRDTTASRDIAPSASRLPDQITSQKVFLQSAYTANKDTIVMFEAQPKISVTESADYDTLQPIHSVTGFVSFKTSHMKKIGISDIKLFSRTPREASANLKRLNILKSWLKPYFGQAGEGVDGTSTVDNGRSTVTSMQRMLGAPPDILFLYAYSSASTIEQNLKQIPVVIESMSYEYPNDVDYIPTEQANIPFPVIMSIQINLIETHSPKEAEEFSLAQYKAGTMLTW